MGLTEAEITEHSIRKIMECIIQDFPRSRSGSDASEYQSTSLLAKTEKQKEEEDGKKPVDEISTLTAQLDFDGFTAKMRVRKEITQAKILGLHLSFVKQKEVLRQENNSN